MNPHLPLTQIEALLAEDVPDIDLTTAALGIGTEPGRMEFRARSAMIVAGIEAAAALVSSAGADVSLETASGRRASAGDLLLRASGPAGALHKAWKVAQTLTEILSGISTATRALVDATEAANPKLRVACTRKTVPGARRLSLMAIRAGGAIPHRLGLSDTILVFPEHRSFLPGLSLREIAARLRYEAPEKKIAIETSTLEEAREATEAGFDTIQLEKMQPLEVAAVVKAARGAGSPALIAAAGGITPANAASYAGAGADLIVSSWPYTAKPADVAVALLRG